MVGALVVEVEPSVADAEDFPGWLTRRHPELAERLPEAPGHEQWIAVKIGGTTYDYRVTVTAMRDGAPVGAGGEEFACECVNRMLFERVDEEIGRAVGELQAVAEEEERAAARSVASELDEQTDSSSALLSDGGRSRRLTTLGYAGVAAGAVGLGAMVAGVVLAVRGPYGLEGQSEGIYYRSTRTPGVVLAAGGGVALAAGVTLVVFDAVRQRRRRVHVAANVYEGSAGVSVWGRF
ncbi:MAG: hypothetical protein AAGF11_51415 [Myxococcota bacterium]